MLIMQKKVGTGNGESTSAINTKLLLHFDTDMTDSSNSGHVIAQSSATINGDAKFGTGSFDGVIGTITTLNSSDFNFGTGDWCVDFWMKTGSAVHKYFWDNGTVDMVCAISHLAPSKMGFYTLAGGGHPDLQSTTTVTDNQWHHIAITRDATFIRLFVDGNDESAMIHNDYDFNSSTFVVGGFTAQFADQMDEFRVVKGDAVWTSVFTPPILPYILT